MDKMDASMPKSLLSELFPSKPGDNHVFPFGIPLQLVPEIDVV